MNNKDEQRRFVKPTTMCTIRLNSASKIAIDTTPPLKVFIDNYQIKDITREFATLIENAVQAQIIDARQDYQDYILEWGVDSDKRLAVQILKKADPL
jgi:hypothetical protein